MARGEVTNTGDCPAELRYWNVADRDWVQDESTFDLWVGGSSTAALGEIFEVTAT